MTDAELRALVREAIAQVGQRAPSWHAEAREASEGGRQHLSYALFRVPSGADTDGPCIIEPSVMCNHCGYCKSYGH